jgi:hypothetical protein
VKIGLWVSMHGVLIARWPEGTFGAGPPNCTPNINFGINSSVPMNIFSLMNVPLFSVVKGLSPLNIDKIISSIR